MEQVTTRPAQAGAASTKLVTIKAKTDTLVLAANSARVGGRITNESAAIVWLCLGKGPAVEKQGIPLAAKGSFDLAGYGGEVRAIATLEEKEELVVVELATGAPSLLVEDEAFTSEPPANPTLAPGWTATPSSAGGSGIQPPGAGGTGAAAYLPGA